MSKVVIRRRISLEFLGEEYKDAYLVLRAVAVSEYEDVLGAIDKAKDAGKKVKLMLELIKDRFLAGKFPNEKGDLEDIENKDDLDGLDGDSLAHCFRVITGQADPKGEPSSTSSSPTAANPPSNT